MALLGRPSKFDGDVMLSAAARRVAELTRLRLCRALVLASGDGEYDRLTAVEKSYVASDAAALVAALAGQRLILLPIEAVEGGGNAKSDSGAGSGHGGTGGAADGCQSGDSERDGGRRARPPERAHDRWGLGLPPAAHRGGDRT